MEFLINYVNETILHLACKSGNNDLVKYILSLNTEIIELKTVFFFNLLNDVFNWNLFSFLKSKNLWSSKNINIFETVLDYACQSGNIYLVEYIVSLNKIDINSKSIFKLKNFIKF